MPSVRSTRFVSFECGMAERKFYDLNPVLDILSRRGFDKVIGLP
jgi:hypothetical protein